MKKVEAHKILDTLAEGRKVEDDKKIEAGKWFRQQLRTHLSQTHTLVMMTRSTACSYGSEYKAHSTEVLSEIAEYMDKVQANCQGFAELFPELEPAWSEAYDDALRLKIMAKGEDVARFDEILSAIDELIEDGTLVRLGPGKLIEPGRLAA